MAPPSRQKNVKIMLTNTTKFRIVITAHLGL